MSDGSILEISLERVEGVDVVTIDGEVDLTNAQKVHAAVADTSTAAVVLDLSAVTYLDSAGIRELDKSNRLLTADDRSLVIVSPPESPADWTLRVAGFKPSIVLPSVDDAVAAAAARLGPLS